MNVRPVVCLAAILGGCADLADHRGVFSGVVVGTDDLGCDPSAGPCSAFRRGFAQNTVLTYDRRTEPGSLTTCEPGTRPCDPGSIPGRVFDASPLLRVGALEHDLLSRFDFPGGTRLRNEIYVVGGAPGGPLEGREAVVFVSLMDSGRIEVRVLAGSGERPGDHYGLFVLERR
ncbi:MAG: hypothetical protein NZ898_01670 [Myxococcota bacterium]|nr:hypothetical protein [Myxococcota bacterium]MDW8362728.1 hypothetical protein [Myxococcales bacterium]